ncbi:MAG: pantetheine-phosphate adenylyltransferase [Pseudomonadota bacterium]|nr:pantetheine-phosphate adenylyltransferase [Pseudomonadota bacterium]
MKITAVYPGTFDPITLGHFDIVSRASPLFDSVIMAIAESTSKNTVFSIAERVELARKVVSDLPNIEVQKFDGLMVDFARKCKASVVLRGLRAVSDFEYEFQLAGMNRKLMSEVDTIFMPTSEKYTYISSSLVREIASYGGNVSDFVDPQVASALSKRFVKANHKKTKSQEG